MTSLAISGYTACDYLSNTQDGWGTTGECKAERRFPLAAGRILGRLRISHGLRSNGAWREIAVEIEGRHGTSWLHVQAKGTEGGSMRRGWCDERLVALKCISGENLGYRTLLNTSINFKVQR